jgi:uncharacterized peroxidase-related enzyme
LWERVLTLLHGLQRIPAMPHIHLDTDLPGIRGLFAFRPETAAPMSMLAQVLLHDQNTLTRAEREMIATYVSHQNACRYCETSHEALTVHHLNGDEELVRQVKANFETALIPEKLKALIAIAGKVQQSGKNVLPGDIERARRSGATDREIHDTVLIAAAFCMYNRYVDGLATFAPSDSESYRERAAGVAVDGYMKLVRDIGASK